MAPPSSFVNYCGGDTWLSWLFLVDFKANFLLANSAGGRMPRHLQIESGFGEEVSSLDNSSAHAQRSNQGAIEEEIDRAKAQQKQISDAIGAVTELLEQQKRDKTVDKEDQQILQVEQYSRMLTNEKVLASMSPDSQSKYRSAIQRKRRRLLDDMASGK